MIHITTWVKSQGIMLSKKSQIQKVTNSWFYLCNIFLKDRILEMKGRGIRDMEGSGREGCDYRRTTWRNSLVVWWLGLSALTAKGPGSIPTWETKISQAMWAVKKKN